MARVLSAAVSSCQYSRPLSFQRSSFPPSTSCALHWRTHWNSRCSVRFQAELRGGGGPERRSKERDEVADLESALGIENKTVRKGSPKKGSSERRPMSVLDALEEEIRKNEANRPPESPLVQNVRRAGDWLIDKTENTGQDYIVVLAFAIFPIWFLALLVTSGVIHLPFNFPFLHI